jgi:multidrug efflux pump subunit AcrA (membrane-fusion protein)
LERVESRGQVAGEASVDRIENAPDNHGDSGIMKNAMMVILLLATIVLGYVFIVDNLRVPLGDKGELTKVIRGDLTLPITATGEVLPARRIVMKAEASGEVIEILRLGGDLVRKGDVLIRLEQTEEQRSVDRSRQDVTITKARWEQAKINLSQAKGPDLKRAGETVAQFEDSVRLLEFRKRKIDDLPEHQRTEEDVLQRTTVLAQERSKLEIAKADVENANLSIDRLEQVVSQEEASYNIAVANLADAQKRLRKTDIVAPIDGLVSTVRTQVGEIVQGGKTTLTGGTELVVLLDTSRLVVRAEVDEADIGQVLEIAPDWARPGNDGSIPAPTNFSRVAAEMEQAPRISVEAFREEQFTGVIERIYPEPKVLSNVVTYEVDVVVVGENREKLLPRMRAEVEFTSEHLSNVVLCPNEAIREGPDNRLGVFVPPPSPGDPEADPVFIPSSFGLTNGTYSEVKSGVVENTAVYAKMPRRIRKKDKSE